MHISCAPSHPVLISRPNVTAKFWSHCEPSQNTILLFKFSLFLLFRAAPAAYGVYQARGQIGATAAGLHYHHSNIRSEPCLQPTPQFTATPDPLPTERDQGSNPQPHGSQWDSFPLCHDENSPKQYFKSQRMPFKEDLSRCQYKWVPQFLEVKIEHFVLVNVKQLIQVKQIIAPLSPNEVVRQIAFWNSLKNSLIGVIILGRKDLTIKHKHTHTYTRHGQVESCQNFESDWLDLNLSSPGYGP